MCEAKTRLHDAEERLLATSTRLRESEKELEAAKTIAADKQQETETARRSLADVERQLKATNTKMRKQKEKMKMLRTLAKEPSLVEVNALREVMMLRTQERDVLKQHLESVRIEHAEASVALVQAEQRANELGEKLEQKRCDHRKTKQSLQRCKDRSLSDATAVGNEKRKKRVPVSRLKNKGQATKRREEHVNGVASVAKSKADDQLIDDVKALRMSFENVDFDVKFAEEFPEDDPPMTFDMKVDNEKKALALIDNLISPCDKKCSSLTSIQEHKKVEKSEVTIAQVRQRRNATNDKLATDVGMQCDSESVDVDIRKLLEKVVQARPKLAGCKKMSVFFAADGRSVKHSHHSLGAHVAVLEEGNDVHKHDHLHPIGLCKCHEKHKDFKPHAKRIVEGLEDVQENGMFDGEVACEVHLGGDYKWLALVLGLWAASSKKQCCAHCLMTWLRR